ncbi:hypothetical protein [Thalassospira australica]|uniref:Cap15 family cyclic dinucleotide receptor domain-containing protein n=1 Tax=Thalassospira australica TaxID=1528106 RepID=UPI00051A3748|nr:hypothetical protein [Thalassospira australica]
MNMTIVKSLIYLIVGTSVWAWIGLAVVSGSNFNGVWEFVKLTPKVLTIDGIVAFVIIKWGWRYRIFRPWLFQFPDLNGSYTGFIYSDWVDPQTGRKPSPIPVLLTIRQTCFSIHCLMRTSEMESRSYCEGFDIDPDRQMKRLTYTYTSNPKLRLRERSKVHDGTMLFDIVEGEKNALNGRYWTDRKSTGEIELEFYSSELLSDFPEGFGEHPVTEPHNRR